MPGSKRDGLPAAAEGRSTPELSGPGALKRPPADLPADGPASRRGSEGTQPASSPQARVDGAQAASGASAPGPQRSVGAIQILTGSNAGRELDLTKPLTTLGRPQVQVAVITKRAQGYFITHVEGEKFPTINGKAIDAQAQVLKDHDVIELAGVKMEFYYKE